MANPLLNSESTHPEHALHDAVEQRLGVVPNCFRLAPQQPEIEAELWRFACLAYLDNPLPPLFKERLCAYLSRLEGARYCSARHAGFLLGLGRPAGDARCAPLSVEEVVELLARPLAQGAELDAQLALCSAAEAPLRELPAPGSPLETALFACAAHAFLQSAQAQPCLMTLREVLGESRFQALALLLAYVRAAHGWTQSHPELALEDDVARLLASNDALAECLSGEPERSTALRGESERSAAARGAGEARLRAGGRAAAAEPVELPLRAGRRAGRSGLDEVLRARQLARRLRQRLQAEVAERKRAEEALRQREAQLAALLQRAPLGVYMVDAQLRICAVNPIAAAVFGDIPELIGRELEQVIHILWPAPYADEVLEHFRHTLATGESYASAESGERRLDRGVLEYYEWRLDRIPLPDGSSGVVCYFRDISTRVEARAAIAKSEERFRTLVSVITDVPWTSDAEGRFMTAQPAWSAFTGQSESELRGFGWLDALHPDDREAIRESWARACHTHSVYEARGRLWHAPSQQYRHFMERATPLLEPDGSVREWVGACTDVTDQRAAEEALQEANRRKDGFLATLAHELRNPLAPIRSSVQVMRLAADNPEVVEQARQTIERQLAHMVRLVEDLLDISRISHNKIELRKENVALAVIVQSALETSRPLIESLGHDLVVSLPQQTIWLHADLTRVAQALANLLDNAAKYTPECGRIELRAEQDGDQCVLRVRDTGVGIAEDLLPHIFEMFAQADASRDRSRGGLGIGLMLVKSLVELHGGSVSANSAGPGCGSEFTLRLPIAAAERASATGANWGQGRAGETMGARRLLVVDDNRDAANSLALLLTVMGHEVRTVHDGESALAELREFNADFALLDIGMPGMNGYELARRIRADARLQGIALIAVTGWGQDEDRRRSRDAGFDAHLVKPVGPEVLQTILTRPEVAFAHSTN